MYGTEFGGNTMFWKAMGFKHRQETDRQTDRRWAGSTSVQKRTRDTSAP